METLTIEPLARPLRAHIGVDQKALQTRIDSYWDESKETIIQRVGYKGKKEKGGTINFSKARKHLESSMNQAQLYGSALVEYAADVIEKDGNIKVLAVNSINLAKDNSTIDFDFFEHPHLAITDLEGLSLITVDNINPPDPESILIQLKNELRYKLTKLEVSSEEIEETDTVVYSLNKERPNTIRFIDLPPELQSKFLGLKEGDSAILESKMVLKIVQVLRGESLSDEEVIEKSEHDSMEDLENIAKDRATKDYLYQKGVAAWEVVIQFIVDNSNMEAIPEQYLDRSAASFLKQHLAHFNGDSKKACEMSKVDSEAALLQNFKDKVLGDIVRKMAVDAYLAIHDLPSDIAIGDLADYMAEKVTWKELPQYSKSSN